MIVKLGRRARRKIESFKITKRCPSRALILKNLFLFVEADDGPTAGRLLVEVVEGVNLGTRSALCEVRLGNQVQYTPALGPPYKWAASMQFLVRDISVDILTVALVAKYDFRPDGKSNILSHQTFYFLKSLITKSDYRFIGSWGDKNQ